MGLGVASRYILTFPKVNRLTTIESNTDIMEVNRLIDESDRKYSLDYDQANHSIFNVNGIEYAYQTKRRYDFIFINCYTCIDEETLPLIADMYEACSRTLKKDGKIIAWLDRHTPEPFYTIFQGIKEKY